MHERTAASGSRGDGFCPLVVLLQIHAPGVACGNPATFLKQEPSHVIN